MNFPKHPSRFTPSANGIARIAALGARSFSDQAAQRLAEHFRQQYGHDVEVSNHRMIDQVWRMQDVDSAFLMPLQNSGSGLVPEHWPYIKAIHRGSAIKIVADINHEVRMGLSGIPGIDPARATRVLSHFQAIRQSSLLVGKSEIGGDRTEAPVMTSGSLQHINMHESAPSTVEALRRVAERRDPRLLGLGTLESAADNGLTVYNSDASNLPAAENITQMLLLQRTHDGESFHPELPYHGLLVVLDNQRGALRDLLAPIADSGADVTALHKKPMEPDQRWVQFFVELDTSAAHDARSIAASIQDIPHVVNAPYTGNAPSWHSWSDRIQSAPCVPERQYQIVDWTAAHEAIRQDLQSYTMLVTPKQMVGVLHTLLDVIAKNNADIQTFDSVTIGHKQYAFRMTLNVSDAKSMHAILDEYQRSELLNKIELSALS